MKKQTDRELLELAAKAGGIEGEYECWTGQGFKQGIRQVLNGAKCYKPWNSLDDDGDALRLVVKLNIHVLRFDSMTTTRPLLSDWACDERDDGDAMGATRRAITRAAAEIGKAMQ